MDDSLPRGTYLGIDFSGDATRWGSRHRRSNVWIATAVAETEGLRLGDLRRVQELPGEEPPFMRLCRLLGAGEYRVAAIDASFSIPDRFAGDRSHDDLLSHVDALPCRAQRPFPTGETFLAAMAGALQRLDPPKPLRASEARWQRRGINVRSGLWNGPRPGAPMTAACMKLLAGSRRPLWPWAEGAADGLLAEAFPAAQLATWDLPYQGYGAPEQGAARDTILAGIRPRLALTEEQEDLLRRDADALDAVLCLFAAVAVATGRAPGPDPDAPWHREGWIAVHP
ncbi:MAG: DUF429 domain-containing protein [Planctomycetota bacterium]|jgi:hypothetical protein